MIRPRSALQASSLQIRQQPCIKCQAESGAGPRPTRASWTHLPPPSRIVFAVQREQSGSPRAPLRRAPLWAGLAGTAEPACRCLTLVHGSTSGAKLRTDPTLLFRIGLYVNRGGRRAHNSTAIRRSAPASAYAVGPRAVWTAPIRQIAMVHFACQRGRLARVQRVMLAPGHLHPARRTSPPRSAM